MKYQSRHSQKKLISNTLFAGFFIVVLSIGYMSNSFKIPVKTPNEFIEATQTFTAKEFTNIDQVTILNVNGPFIFQKDLPTNQWHLISPEKHEKESIFVEKLLNSLSTIKTKNVLDYTNSNLTNYSLINTPNRIILTNTNAKETIAIDLGLINTIDNSTYIKIEGKKGIYHVEAPISNFDSITIADLIEKKPFEFNKETLAQIKLINFKNKKLNLTATKSAESWVDQENKPLDTIMVNDFIDDLSKLKSNKVIIQKSKEQEKALKNLQSKIEFQINVKLTNGKELQYTVSDLTRSFPEISLNDEYHYLVKENTDETLHFVRSENLSIFNSKSNSL